jgi:DNA polymerase-1
VTTALIDGDIIAYQVAAMSQTPGIDWGDGEATEGSFNEREVEVGVKRLVDQWTDLAGCTDRLVLLTGPGNFRKAVEPTYKFNRKPAAKPLGLGYAKAYMQETLGARLVDGLEADDLIGLSLTGKYADGKGIAVSIDKDMQTLPGLQMNPNKDLKPREQSAVEADRYWMTQTLMGDSTDGYGGAPGIGPKKAEKILLGKTDLVSMWAAVLAGYATVKATQGLALTTARLARILRRGDYDPQTQEVHLWAPSSDRPRLSLVDVLKT